MICGDEELHKRETGFRDPESGLDATDSGCRIPLRRYFGFFVVSVGAAVAGFAFDVSPAAFGFGFAA